MLVLRRNSTDSGWESLREQASPTDIGGEK